MADEKKDDSAAIAYGKVIARAWRDPAFKAKLFSDPHGALKEAGLAVVAGVTLKVVEDTASCVHLVLPPKPTGQLSDQDLDKVAGGMAPPNHGGHPDPRHTHIIIMK